jgi:hypothetical protein
MAHFIFRCPAIGVNVQHQLDGDPDISENEYEGIICPACTRLHLINRKTRKLLGEAKGSRPNGPAAGKLKKRHRRSA